MSPIGTMKAISSRKSGCPMDGINSPSNNPSLNSGSGNPMGGVVVNNPSKNHRSGNRMVGIKHLLQGLRNSLMGGINNHHLGGVVVRSIINRPNHQVGDGSAIIMGTIHMIIVMMAVANLELLAMAVRIMEANQELEMESNLELLEMAPNQAKNHLRKNRVRGSNTEKRPFIEGQKAHLLLHLMQPS